DDCGCWAFFTFFSSDDERHDVTTSATTSTAHRQPPVDDSGTYCVTLPEDVQLSGKAHVKPSGGQQVALVLTSRSLEWMPFASSDADTHGCILLYDVLQVRVLPAGAVKKPASVNKSQPATYASVRTAMEVTLLPRSKPKDKTSKRVMRRQVLFFDRQEEATEWRDAIHSVMHGERIGVVPVPRRLLVVVNPVGGTKIAVPTFEKQVRPLLELAGISFQVILTTHQNHAMEIARDLALDKFDAIVTVSGDGLLHEMVNGLFSRPDWPEAAKLPVGIIPCGSGNGLAKSLEIRDIPSATLAAIKGHTRPLDVMACHQPGIGLRYAFLGIYWGLIADVDIESEKYRWAGAARFTAAFIGRVLSMRRYAGKITYLPANPHDEFDPHAVLTNPPSAASSANKTSDRRQSEADAAFSATATAAAPTAAHIGPPIKFLHADANGSAHPVHGEDWRVIEGEFVMVLGLNVSWIDQTTHIAPYAHHHDGFIDLMYITAPCSKLKLLTMFADIESGKHVDNELVKYVKCRAFTLEPNGRGIVDVDGEQVATANIAVECHGALLNVLCPPDLDRPHLKNFPVYHSQTGHLHQTVPALPAQASSSSSSSSSGPRA
ncbi:diacylglycerol kinase, partial [Capsaspora owczarzaki ATCC 30864]